MNSAIWNKNKSALADWDKNLVGLIESSADEQFKIQWTSEKTPYLVIQTPTGSLIKMDDQNDPIGEARQLLPDFGPKTPLIVLFGVGAGHILREAANRYPEARFIVIERDPKIFRKALEAVDLSDVLPDNRFVFLIGLKPNRLYKLIYHAFMFHDFDLYLSNVQVLKNDRLIRFSLDYYGECSEVFKNCVETYWDLYVGNAYQDALKGLAHVLENQKYNDKCFSLEPYRNRFQDKPGILIASGPSLTQRLPFLRAMQDKAVLICADSALKLLLANGIKPHGVVCVERDDINSKLFEGYEIPKDVALFAPPVIKPKTFLNYPGPIGLVYRQAYPFYALPEILPSYNIGISCAHFAYFVLAFLGCKQIYLCGQDLAYDRARDVSHFDGAIPEALDQYAKKERIPAPDNQGGMISSGSDWILFRDIYAELIPYLRETLGHHDIINLIESDKGLAIPFTERHDPKDVEAHFSMSEISKINLDREWKLGFADLSARLESHASEAKKLDEQVGEFLKSLEDILAQLALLQSAQNYRSTLQAWLKKQNTKIAYLYSDLAKPHLRKFDANAMGIWTQQEFLQHYPEYLGLLKEIAQDLQDVWLHRVNTEQFYSDYAQYPGFLEFLRS